MAWVARGQQRGDKNNDMVTGLDKRVTSLEEHRQFLESLMSKIDTRFDKLEAKLERR
jgi:chaperonin cofactor prefoldin